MSREQYELIKEKINELETVISELSESSGNGQLIDAISHTRCAKEHLRRYFMKTQKCEVKQ